MDKEHRDDGKQWCFRLDGWTWAISWATPLVCLLIVGQFTRNGFTYLALISAGLVVPVWTTCLYSAKLQALGGWSGIKKCLIWTLLIGGGVVVALLSAMLFLGAAVAAW